MTKPEPSPNFKALLQVINDEKTLNRDKYIHCLAFLPTIRTDIQFLFDDLSEDDPKKREKPLDKILENISKIFSYRKPADFHFTQDELFSKIKSLVLIKQRLLSFNVLNSYFLILNHLLSFTKNNHEVLNAFRGYLDQSNNKEVVYSAFAMNFDEIRQEAFLSVVREDDSHLKNPILLFSFSNIISVYEKYDNVPQELKHYVEVLRIQKGLMPTTQLSIVDQSNKSRSKNSNETKSNSFSDNSRNIFILYFLVPLQTFYPPYQAISIDAGYGIMYMNILKSNDYAVIYLVTKFMAAMPATDENDSFPKNNQFSTFIIETAKYILDFDSDISQNILTFAQKRDDASMFVETIISMVDDPEKYRAAIYIGLHTNMFSNGTFVAGCFPAKVTEKDLFIPILESMLFLIQKSFIQKTNIPTILISVFSILSNRNDKGEIVLDLTLKAFQGIINADLINYIYLQTVDSACDIHTHYLIPIIQLLIENKSKIPNLETRQFLSDQLIKKYFKCIAAIARLIENDNESYISDQNKLTLLNFLNLINCFEISKPPENDDQKIRDYWSSMRSKFTILYLMKYYVLNIMATDQHSTNFYDDFISTISTLFNQDHKYAVVVSLLPYTSNTEETIDRAILVINDLGIKSDFVSFYNTRLYISPDHTLKKLKAIVDDNEKNKNKLLPGILDLIGKISQQLTSCEDYITYSTFNRQNDEKEIEQKKKECESIYKSIGIFLEKLKYYKNEKVFNTVQIESRMAVFEASKNPNIILSDKFINDIIGIPFFYNSFSYLLRKLKSPTAFDAECASKAWVHHLMVRDHDHCFNREIAKDLLSTIAKDKSQVITKIVSSILDDIKFADDDNEDNNSYNNNDEKAYVFVNFLEEIAINGCSKTYAYSTSDPKIVIYFSRFCFSKNDKVRESAFRFIINYFAILFPYTDGTSNVQNSDPLCFYMKKHTQADRILVFLSLFQRVFSTRKVLAREVFEGVTKMKKVDMHHVLLCKSIVLTNFVSHRNNMDVNISFDTDADNSYNAYNYNSNYNYNRMNNPNVNRPIMNPAMNPNENLGSNVNNDSADQLTNDDLIPNSVLYKFSKLIFRTAKVSFEAQETVKLIAIKDIDKFIHFIMGCKSTDFTACVVRKIMYSTRLRNSFIDSFICYIFRCGIPIGSNKELNENDIKITDAEVAFLNFIITSDNSGELIYMNRGKLLLIFTMLIGISNRSKDRSKLKNNTKLSEMLTLITSSNYINRKQINELPKLIQLNTDDDEKFSKSLSEIANELMNLEPDRFKEFIVCSKNCVRDGVNCVYYSIAVLLIHLSSAFSQYGSATAMTMRNPLWSIVTEAFHKSNSTSHKNLRLLTHELNKLTDPIIREIPHGNKINMLDYILDSLSDPLDDYRANAVEMVCRLFLYSNDISSEYREKIITNLQIAFQLTTKEKDRIKKGRGKEKEKMLNPQPVEKEKSNAFTKIFTKNKNKKDAKEKVEDLRYPELDQKVLNMLNILAEGRGSSAFSIFGSWKKTRLSNVDIAELICKGNQIQRQLASQLFMSLFNVHMVEDVVKLFIIKFSQEDFNELCERIIFVDKSKIDREYYEVLIWIYQSFRNYREIDPTLKQRLFSLSLEISIDSHDCRELALQTLNLFSI